MKFPRQARLKSRRTIASLFVRGTPTQSNYPLRVVYRAVDEPRPGAAPYQVTFVVPKRKFKRATDRNRLKRRMREAYRLHQDLLPAGPPRHYALLFMYTGGEEQPFALIERKMIKLLRRVQHRLPDPQ